MNISVLFWNNIIVLSILELVNSFCRNLFHFGENFLLFHFGECSIIELRREMREMKNRIKDLRIEKNLTQEDLAKILNVSRGNISKYENDGLDVSSDKLIILSDFFNVSTDYLLGIVDEKEIVLVKSEELPQELKEHIEGIAMLKEAKESGLSNEDIKEILEIAIRSRRKH